MPVFVGAGTSSFMKGSDGVGMSTATTSTRNALSGVRPGQMIFNHTTNLMEYYNGTSWISIDTPPTVSSVSPTEVESAAGGNVTFTINGARFSVGATVQFISSTGVTINASPVTRVSSSQLTAVAAKNSFVNGQEPYDVKVTNASGLATTLNDQINVDNAPTWSTSAGTIATIDDVGDATHATITASDAEGDTVAYSITSGSLPGGLSLNSSSGAITGEPNNVSSSTTSTFTARATANSKTADRSFNIVVTPANDGTSSARACTNPTQLYNDYGTNTSGVYWIKSNNFNSGTAVQAYFLYDGNTGYLMCCNYLHQSGTNPNLNNRTNSSFPVLGSSSLGTNESGTIYWGHVNGGSNGVGAFGTVDMVRWYGKASGHSRVIHFQHNNSGTITWANTGSGSHSGLNNGGQNNLTGHSANLPNVADNLGSGWTGFPYYRGGQYHWGLKGGNRWEVDDYQNNENQHTLHRVWVRYS